MKKIMALLSAAIIMLGIFTACDKTEVTDVPTPAEEAAVSLAGSYWKAVEFTGEDASDEYWADLFLWEDGFAYLRVSQASAESGYWGMRDITDCDWFIRDETLILTESGSSRNVICSASLEQDRLILAYEGFLSLTIIMEQSEMPLYGTQWEIPELYGIWRMISYTDVESGYHLLDESDSDIVSEITIHQVAGVDIKIKNYNTTEVENELWYTYKEGPIWDGCINEAWYIELNDNSDPGQCFYITYADGRLLLKKDDKHDPHNWPYSFTAEYMFMESSYNWGDGQFDPAGAYVLEYDELIDLYRDIKRYANDAEDNHDSITYNIAYALNIDNEQLLYNDLSNSIFELCFEENFGYALHDINGDGIVELIILSQDHDIYAIYTLRENKPVLVGAYWSRSRIALDKNGTLYHSGSSGADNSFDARYTLNTWQDGELLILIETIGIEDFDDETWQSLPKPRYYRIKNGEKTIISEEEANAAWKNFQKAYSGDNRDAELVFIPINGRADYTNNVAGSADAADALHLLFDSFFDDEDKEMMQYIDFIDNNAFFGCEYQIYADANPRRIEYWGMSSDQNYHIFWLNEQVYHDGVFSHEVTVDFVAVPIEIGEIIWEGRDSGDPDDWNDGFPW